MKKRLLITLNLALMLVLMFATTSFAMRCSLSDDDFNFTITGANSFGVTLLDDVSILNDTMGTAISATNKTIEVPIVDYLYKDIAFHADESNRIVCITGSRIITSRGIKIGKSSSDVFNAYGNPDMVKSIRSAQRMLIYYGPNGKKLIFKVSSMFGPERVFDIQADVYPFSGDLRS